MGRCGFHIARFQIQRAEGDVRLGIGRGLRRQHRELLPRAIDLPVGEQRLGKRHPHRARAGCAIEQRQRVRGVPVVDLHLRQAHARVEMGRNVAEHGFERSLGFVELPALLRD